MTNAVGNILLVAGGARPDSTAVQRFLDSLPPVRFVVAVDSGLDHARNLGLAVNTVVGDMDSVSTDALAWARRHKLTIDEHPARKDETDLELGVATAVRLLDESGQDAEASAAGEPPLMSFIGLSGDRSDHVVANLQVVAGPRTRRFAVRALLDDSTLAVVGGDRAERTVELVGSIGDRVSLHPFGGSASGVSTAGLEYPLRHEGLEFGSARGISNVMAEDRATVSVQSGTVVVLQELASDWLGTDPGTLSGGELDETG